MTLEEAIRHCREKAKELSDKAYEEWGKTMTEEEAYDCNECAREHEQLAKWLEELKDYKEGRNTCEFCEHKFRTEYERPCSLCKHNFTDKFEREKDTGEEKEHG